MELKTLFIFGEFFFFLTLMIFLDRIFRWLRGCREAD